MLGRRELPGQRAPETDDQEDRPDDHMGAVKAGRHEEGRPVDIAAIAERRVVVLERLHGGERQAQNNGADQPPFEAVAVVLEQRVMRPCNGGAGGQQDQRIDCLLYTSPSPRDS